MCLLRCFDLCKTDAKIKANRIKVKKSPQSFRVSCLFNPGSSTTIFWMFFSVKIIVLVRAVFLSKNPWDMLFLWSFTSRVIEALKPKHGTPLKAPGPMYPGSPSVPVDAPLGFERRGGIEIPRYRLIMGSPIGVYFPQNYYNNVKTTISRCISY